ncbi:MAG: SpoIIE family protein phosphatase [Acidobacteriota bacterium]
MTPTDLLSLPPLTAVGDDQARSPRSLPVYRLYRSLRRLMVSLGAPGGAEEVALYLLKSLTESSAEADDPEAPAPIFLGGRAYRREGETFELFAKEGDGGGVPLGYQVPARYPVVADLLERGWVLVRPSDPRYDASLEAPIGGGPFAGIVVGPATDIFISFTLSEPVADSVPDAELIYALTTLKSASDIALRQRDLITSIHEARQVQTSLLPTKAPDFPGFEIAFRARPAELVGGDLYDFRQRHEDDGPTLGIALGDATGHGLPAALQARDAVVGLRMAAEDRRGLLCAVEALSRVTRAGGTGSRFISLVCLELSADGRISYVNAGHIPPLILRADGRIDNLPSTGRVMGLPVPARYHQRSARLEPGDILVLYTDGIPEARNGDDEEFGLQRMAEVAHQVQARQLQEWRSQTRAEGGELKDVVDAIFEASDHFIDYVAPADDQTLVLVRRDPVLSL